MATFGDLKDIIARDLGRHLENLHGDELGEAVKNAILFYAHEPFWSLETGNTSITTVAGTAAYSKPATVLEIINVTVTVSGNQYPLDERSYGWYLERNVTPTLSLGQPIAYALFQDKIYLYPTPSDAWTLTLWCTQLLATLSDDDDDTAWTNDAQQQLIRAAAKADIFANRLELPEQAGVQRLMAAEWLRRLRERSVAEQGVSCVTPTQW